MVEQGLSSPHLEKFFHKNVELIPSLNSHLCLPLCAVLMFHRVPTLVGSFPLQAVPVSSRQRVAYSWTALQVAAPGLLSDLQLLPPAATHPSNDLQIVFSFLLSLRSLKERQGHLWRILSIWQSPQITALTLALEPVSPHTRAPQLLKGNAGGEGNRMVGTRPRLKTPQFVPTMCTTCLPGFKSILTKTRCPKLHCSVWSKEVRRKSLEQGQKRK